MNEVFRYYPLPLIDIDESKKESEYKAKNIVISTGSNPTSLQKVKIDENFNFN